MSEVTHSNEVASPKEQVERLVTNLWEHPLLDDATVAHRKAALTALPKLFAEFDINEKEYVGILKGSSQRIISETSDFDFTIIRPVQFINAEDEFTDAQMAGRKKEPSIDISSIFGISLDNPMMMSNFLNTMTELLFTPDEYLVGNLDLAHQYRFRAVSQLKQDSKSEKLVWGDSKSSGRLPLQFADCFKNWGIFPQTSRIGIKMRHDSQNRLEKEQGRLQANIEKRAALSRNPHWGDDFMHAIKELTPPSFEMYAAYLEQTNGAVHIDPRFSAQNLTTSI